MSILDITANPPAKEKIELAMFESEIAYCAKQALGTFGAGVTEVISYNVLRSHGMKLGEIAYKPQEFTECVDRIFGCGSFHLKKAIIDHVKARFGLVKDYSSLELCLGDALLKSQRE